MYPRGTCFSCAGHRTALQRHISLILFISAKGLDHVAEHILSFLDARALCSAELVCKEWHRVISEGMLWKKLIERMVLTDPLWKGLSERRGWYVGTLGMGDYWRWLSFVGSGSLTSDVCTPLIQGPVPVQKQTRRPAPTDAPVLPRSLPQDH